MKREYYLLLPKLKSCILLLATAFLLVLGMVTGHAQVTETLTTTGNGTWVSPPGVTSITVECWGAGGGGQRVTGNTAAGGGGSGGGYVRTTYTVTPNTSYAYYIGAGGLGTTGSNGENSWFINATTILAVGGRGAGAPITNNNTWGTGAIAFTTGNIGGTLNSTYGGNGGNAGNNFSGGGGSSSGTTASNNAVGMTGGAAPTDGFAGANGRNTNGGGANGGIGAGGAGGRTSNNDNYSGGSGGRGQLRITYNNPNALCTNALTLPCGTVNMNGFTIGSSNTPHGSGCSMSNFGVWYTFVGDGQFTTISSTASGGFDHEMSISSGTCVTKTNIACINNNGANGTESYTFQTTNGITYFVYIAHQSNSTSTTGRFTISRTCVPYCTPVSSDTVHGSGITNVTFSTVNNNSNDNQTYNDYSSLVGSALQGAAMPISVTTNTGNNSYNIKIWVDWNNDFDMTDPGEEVFSGIVNSNTINGTINIPLTATVGNHRLRVGIARRRMGGGNEIPVPCFNGTRGAYEDYTLNVLLAIPCTNPPAIVTNPSNTTVATTGTTSFTASFNGNPTSYIWQVSTDGGVNFTPITNGGVYSGANSPTLTITNPPSSMNGFIYQVAASNGCGTSAFSTPRTLTVTVTYCTPTSTSASFFISGIASEGNLNDMTNAPTGYSAGGYGNFSNIIIATQVAGGGINIDINLVGTQFIRGYVDWNGDGDFIDAGEEIYTTGNTATGSTSFGFVVPNTVLSGNYRFRIRTLSLFSSLTISPCNALSSGETEDYTIKVVPDCAAKIDYVINGSVCGANNPVTIQAVGLGNTTHYRWYTTETGGSYIAQTTSGSYTTAALSNTTIFYVTAFNGSCESLVRTRVVATILPTTIINFSPVAPTTCGDNEVITINASGDYITEELLFEDFENGLGAFTVTTPTNNNGGVDSPWSIKTSTYQPTATSVWRPAISSGSIDNNFAFTTSDYTNNVLVTQLFTTLALNTTAFVDLTLTFDHYYSYFNGDNGRVQISTNNGTSWTDLSVYTSDIGSASKFTKESINLTPYINQPAVLLRFQYTGGWDDGWAIDNIRIFGTKLLNTTFSWNGSEPVDAFTDFACTTPYTNQSISTIYIRPNLSQLLVENYPFVVSATLGNGCTISETIIITNKSKVWQGTTNDWSNANNWLPLGAPLAVNCVVIPPSANQAVISGSNYAAFANTITVKNGGQLIVESNNSITVTNRVTVENGGLFTLENNSSLVQIDNVFNSGTITYKREATNIKGLDYVYWSSPVANQNLNSIYTSPPQGPRFRWNPILNNGNGNGGNISQGTWVNANGNVMEVGRGYIVRGSSNAAMAPTTLFSTFSGVANNGSINYTVERGQYTGAPYAGLNGTMITNLDDNWNLLGNPYPSSINALRFLSDNSSVILGSVRLWTHGSDIALTNGTTVTNPFYGSFAYNYSSSDYLFINFTGSTVPTASDYIKTGQAFFVQMVDGPGNASATVNFNNSQRSNAYPNNNFFRQANIPMEENSLVPAERHRIWLDLVSPTQQSITTMIGYVTGATNDKDSFFDASEKVSGSMGIFSAIGDETFAIQGRSLPFSVADEVPITVKTSASGTHHLAILTVDGLFEEQVIYVKDALLNVIHNLKEAPYAFTATAGVHSNRFSIVYQDEALGLPDTIENQVVAFKDQFKQLHISTGNETMEQVQLYDLQGRLLKTIKDIQQHELSVNISEFADQVLMVSILTASQQKITKKIL